ncbi:hypothetical protein BV898_19547 [Hypsibius exemplaris]|uniref:Uncharacterized protein n=1 Tax=Hypsibius exemplaris TaxID=2072580 RepID=A0A9X6RPQ4_HYPEX|nr:hypothetical protein BV898_19547 [Hypsibius exemplaris]
MGSIMLVKGRKPMGNEEPGENNSIREANHNRFHTGTWGYHRSRGNPQLLQLGGPHFKTQCTTPTGGRDHRPDSSVNLYKGVQDMADLSIFVIEFGINENNYSAMTLSVADRLIYREPVKRDIYLSYADSYMMLEGRFCQRRLENINYDWDRPHVAQYNKKHRYKGPKDREGRNPEAQARMSLRYMSESDYEKVRHGDVCIEAMKASKGNSPISHCGLWKTVSLENLFG